MFTVFIIGEHHNFPTAKNFIADNANSFADCNLRNLHLEGVEPKTIPFLKPHPEDKYKTLESYQRLYSACSKENINMHMTEDVQSRIKIDSGLDSCLFDKKRESVFIKSMQNTKGGIIIMGAGHVAKICNEFIKQGANVFVIQTTPGMYQELEDHSKDIPHENMLYKTAEMAIKKSLPNLLVEKMVSSSKAVQTEMKYSERDFPKDRKNLERLYISFQSFSNLKNTEFQTAYASLEYLLGSLYARENELDMAILYTQKSYDRKVAQNLSKESITTTENKLITLQSKKISACSK